MACVDCAVGPGPDCAHAPRHSIIPSAITSLGRKIPAVRKPRPLNPREDLPLFGSQTNPVSMTIIRPFFDGLAQIRYCVDQFFDA